MIIVNLKGGLGNQMFQYAAGRALSIQRGDILALDISGYSQQPGVETPRPYELTCFTITAPIATSSQIKSIKYPFGIFSKAWRFYSKKILKKFYIDYHPEALHYRTNLYLDGFFQSELYFKQYADQIKADFSLALTWSPQGLVMKNTLDHANQTGVVAVSLHIRRGDYATDPKTMAYHGLCSIEYYEQAIKKIAELTGKIPSLFIFSDDIEWVKAHLKTSFPTTYVSGTSGLAAYEELILMSICKHHIIANSSFSWWGAWLGSGADSITIAPQRWTNHEPDTNPTIIPPSWIRL